MRACLSGSQIKMWEVTTGPVVSEEYFAGYIVEKSLSVDNLFVLCTDYVYQWE